MLSFVAEHSREEGVALIRPAGEVLTYGSMAMATAAVRQALEARAGDVGQRLVAIAVSDGAQLLASLLAVLESGGVALPLDARRGLDFARSEARRARAVALIAGDSDEDRLDVEPIDPTRVALPAEAALALPAGSRRALFSRSSLAGAAEAWLRAASLTAETRLGLTSSSPMLLLPALATLRAGGTLVDVSRLEPMAQLDALARLDGNALAAFPAQLDTLARAVNDQGASRPRLSRVIACGPSLSAPLIDEIARAFPDAALANVYTLCEALLVAAADSPAPGSAGHAPDGVSLAIDDGRLVVHSPWTMLGYLHDPEATRAALITRDDRRWLDSGWRARLDDNGLLLGARGDETLELDGERIDPAALESELRALPGVSQAAVLVVPDRRLGPRLIAFVSFIAGDGKFARPPARVVTLLSLPRAPDGEIDRQALRRMASAE